MRAEAIAEVDAEDLVRADDYYHLMPYFRCADKQDFYKKPVLCAAHVVGIADPVKYRKSNNSQEPKVVEAPINEVGHPRGLKEKLIDQIRAIQADRRNALDTLAYERAKFHADCAARNIRTTEDAERAWTRIAVARAEVVSQEILELDMTLSNVVLAGGTGGAHRQPTTYGIVAQGHWSAIAVIRH